MANIKIINVLITIAILSVLISVNADEVNCNKAIKSSVNAVKNNFEGGDVAADILEELPIETRLDINQMLIETGGVKQTLQRGSLADFKVYDKSTGKIKKVSILGAAKGETIIAGTEESLRYFDPIIFEGGFSNSLKSNTIDGLINNLKINDITATNIGRVTVNVGGYNLILVEEAQNVKKVTGSAKKVYYVVNDNGNIARVSDKLLEIIKKQNKKVIIP